MVKSETVEFEGKVYYRYPDSRHISIRRYYGRHTGTLHRAIWESHYGIIPKKHDIHFKDNDWDNLRIENLECVTRKQHSNREIHLEQMRTDERRAHLTEIRKEAVKWHGSEAGRAWHREQGSKIFANLPTEGVICVYCGDKFRRKHKRVVTCSKKCSRKRSRERSKSKHSFICEHCGKSFKAAKVKRRFCSASCGYRYRVANTKGTEKVNLV